MQPGQSDGHSFVEEARRTQIIDTAMAVIAEHGLPRASFARIARAAGFSPALISYYFGARETLLAEVLRVADARMDTAMSGPADEPTSYADALRRIVVGYVRRCASHPAEVAAAHAIRESTPPTTDATTDNGGSGELVAFLVEAQDSGEFRPFDREIFADTLFAAMRDVTRQLRARPVQEHEEFAEQLAALFVNAAGAR